MAQAVTKQGGLATILDKNRAFRQERPGTHNDTFSASVFMLYIIRHFYRKLVSIDFFDVRRFCTSEASYLEETSRRETAINQIQGVRSMAPYEA